MAALVSIGATRLPSATASAGGMGLAHSRNDTPMAKGDRRRATLRHCITSTGAPAAASRDDIETLTLDAAVPFNANPTTRRPAAASACT